MGWYNVVEPCVVGQLHYARPTAQPIEVDDEVAEPLVEAGKLESYPANEAAERLDRNPGTKQLLEDAEANICAAVEVDVAAPARTRRTRRSED